MVVLRRLGPMGFYTFAALNTMPISTEAAPLAVSRPNTRAVRYGRPHPRQDDIASLVGNITGQTVSDPAALAQTLGSLFNASASSATTVTDTPSPTISGLLSQITANASVPSMTTSGDTPSATASASDFSFGDSILSQFTSTATYAVPTDDGAGDAWSLLSQIVGAIPTSLPSIPVSIDPTGEVAGDFGGTGSSSWSSAGVVAPGANPDGVGTGVPLGSGATSHGYGGMASQQFDGCAETYTVVAGDTCDAVSSVFDLSPVEFLRMNPGVGAACMNLQLGQEYCVRRSAGHEYDDEGDKGEDEGGGYRQKTVVHIHNHPWPGMLPQGVPVPLAIPSSSPFTSTDGVPPPPPPTLPTSDPSLNSTMADPSRNATDSSSTTDPPGFNSTTPGDSASHSMASNSTVRMGIAGGTSTWTDATLASESTDQLLDGSGNATSAAGADNALSARESTSASSGSGSSPSPKKKVEVEWKVEEDF
ncbi:hypothetical protein C8F04DRAFT_414418 [Mycena alexandri]|uniref:LysM domain-containing protein n=1 Tax=Mycena alexandri TaxID=1745969 RepID=A0AAD6X6R1_9AGAR|nr:hypothetical protein C8F04DRAFT_414418 [Mycena alexandri]